jgi:hypothetical protein
MRTLRDQISLGPLRTLVLFYLLLLTPYASSVVLSPRMMTLLSDVTYAKPSLNAVCWLTNLFRILRLKECRATDRYPRHQTTEQFSLSVEYPEN